MDIEVPGANFSASGLGNKDWIKGFAQLTGMTTPHETAARAFYDGCVSDNSWPNVAGCAFFYGSTAATQKYVFKDVPFGSAFPELTFVGNGSSVDGWTPNLGVYAIAPWTPPAGNLTNISIGFYNNTAEPTPAAGVVAEMLSANGDASLGSVADYRFALGRNWQSALASPLGRIGTRDGSTTNQTFPAGGSTDVTRKRLLQIVKEGNTLRLIDDGAQVTQNTSATQVPTGGGSRKLMIGGQMNTTGDIHPTNVAKARLAFVYWGYLTLAQAVTFNSRVNTLLTALGRNAA